MCEFDRREMTDIDRVQGSLRMIELEGFDEIAVETGNVGKRTWVGREAGPKDDIPYSLCPNYVLSIVQIYLLEQNTIR